MKTRYYFYDIENNIQTATTLEEFIETMNIKTHSSNQKYLDNILTFDTETTVSYHYNEDNRVIPEYGFVSMAQFCLDGVLLYCRTVDEAKAVFDAIHEKISEHYAGSKRKHTPKLRCYVHNLGYDYQFIKNSFADVLDDAEVLGEQRSPINVIPKDYNVSFHCSYKLFDRPLAKVAKDYNLKYGKTDGWDYNKYRSTKTSLSDDEVKYGLHDVYALYLALLMKIDEGQYKYIMNVPATKTGEVRYYKRLIVGGMAYIYKSFKEFKAEHPSGIDISRLDLDKVSIHEFKKRKYFDKNNNRIPLYHKGVRIRIYKNEIRKNPETILEHDSYFVSKCKSSKYYEASYILAQLAYAGGFTHAKQDKLGRILRHVGSFDLTSAYPSVMLVKKFVYNWNRSVTAIPHREDGTIDNSKYGYLMRIRLHNLEAEHGISSISLHKVINKDELSHMKYTIDNGRLLSAPVVELAMYDMDYNSLKMLYKWDSEELIECYSGIKQYLLRSELLCILYFYKDKCTYKMMSKEHGVPIEQMEEILRKLKYAKQQLNSLYGCIAMDEWKYFKPEDYETLSDEEKRECWSDFMKMNKNKKQAVTIFSIGGQVTSYVREQIFSAIVMIGYNDLVYSDTDSVKFEHPEKHIAEFETLNAIMQDELDQAIIDNDIDTSGWTERLNRFDSEGVFAYFKTLGAKRYILVKEKEEDGSPLTIRDSIVDSSHNYDKAKADEIYDGVPYNDDDPYIECTVAGVGKTDMMRYLQSKGGTIMNKLRHFGNGLVMPTGSIHKQLTTYVDNDDITYPVIDNYMGQSVSPTHETVGSYIVLSPASFAVGLSDDVSFAISKNLGWVEVGVDR